MLDRARLGWALWRNRLIADPRLRALARWFPPARLPARSYARKLFDLTAGFVYSQILQAFVSSGLLERLARQPMTLAEATHLTGLSESAAATLLRGAASLGLTEERSGRWLLGSLGAALAASPGIAGMVRHHRLFYDDLRDPLTMLRGDAPTRLAALWSYGPGSDPEDAATYSSLMAAMQPMVAEQALAAFDFHRHRALLDVGGGTGGFLREVGRRAPHLRMGLFDRPPVIDEGQNAMPAGVTAHTGDFLRDSLPAGYDLISLVRVLHDHDDEPAQRLLAAVRTALPVHGTLLIVEPLADTKGAEPMGYAYFGFYLAAMRSGRPRRFEDYRRMLQAQGFSSVRRRRTPLPILASVITARA